jgi:nucleotide-binding universal stress UspA family protein
MKRFPPKTILVPTDLSDTSVAALAHARQLAEKFSSTVTVLHVEHFEAPPYFTKAQMEVLEAQRRSVLEGAVDIVANKSAEVLGRRPETLVRGGVPSQTIRETCDERDPDLVVMGTHGRSGVERYWVGSVTERVIRQSRRPVLGVHTKSKPNYEKILVGVNAEDREGRVLDYAVFLAESFQAHLYVVHAASAEKLPKGCPGVTDDLRVRCSIEEAVVKGDAAKNILRIASDVEPDLIVMGGRRWVSVLGEFFSTTTEKVLRATENSLLVVPIKDVEEKV